MLRNKHTPAVTRNAAWNCGGTLAEAVVAFITVPYTIRVLGETSYGVWVLVASLTGSMGLFDLGIRGALGRQLAFHLTREDSGQVNRTFSTAIFLLLVACGASLLGLLALHLVFFWAFEVPPALVWSVHVALAIAGLNLALTFPLNAFDATLWAAQRFDRTNQIDVSIAIVRALLIFTCLSSGNALVRLSLIALVGSILCGLLKLIATLSIYRGLRFHLSAINRVTMSEIFGFGLWNFVRAVADQAVVKTPAVVIGVFFSPAAVTPYSIAERLLGVTRSFFTAAASVLTPKIAGYSALGDHSRQVILFLRGGRLIWLLGMYSACGMCIFGHSFILLWIGPKHAYAAWYLAALAAGLVVPLSQSLTRVVLVGIAKHRLLALIAVVHAGVVIAGCVVAAWTVGALAVCAAAALAATLAAIFEAWNGCRAIDVPLPRYLRKAVLPALAGSAAPVLLGISLELAASGSSVPSFITRIGIYSLGFAVSLYWLCFREKKLAAYWGFWRASRGRAPDNVKPVAVSKLNSCRTGKPRKLTIAIEHGGFGTTGDIAMLITVVRKLREELPHSKLLVRRNSKDDWPCINGIDGCFQGLQSCYVRAIQRLEPSADVTHVSNQLGGHNRVADHSNRDSRSLGPASWRRPAAWLASCLGRQFHWLCPKKVRSFLRSALVILETMRVLSYAVFYRAFGIAPLGPSDLKDFLGAVAKADVFLLAGNGGYTDAFLLRGALPFCLEILVARILGKKVILSGQGVGPLKSSIGRRFVRSAFKQAALCTVREAGSFHFLKSVGVGTEQVLCTGDDAHDLSFSISHADEYLAHMRGALPPPVKTIIAVNVRWATYAMTSPDENQNAYRICKLLLSNPTQGIVLVPMLSDWMHEKQQYEHLMSRLNEPDRVALLPYEPFAPEKVKAALRSADLVVGYSYHFLVFALSAGVPAIGLYESAYYQQKVCGAMEMYGLENSAINLAMQPWDDLLLTRVRDVLVRRSALSDRLRCRNEWLSREISLPILSELHKLAMTEAAAHSATGSDFGWDDLAPTTEFQQTDQFDMSPSS